MKLRSKKGFSLVELIIVIAILGIIAVIAVPNLTGIQKRSQVNADTRTAETIAKAIAVCVTEDRTVPTSSGTAKLNDLLAEKWYNLNNIESDIPNIDFEEYVDITMKPESAKIYGGGEGAYFVRYVTHNKAGGTLLATPRVVVAIHKGADSGNTPPATAATYTLSAVPYNAEFDKDIMIAAINGIEVNVTTIATYDLAE